MSFINVFLHFVVGELTSSTVMTAADSINIYINVHNYQEKNNKNIKHNRPSVDHLDIPMIKFSHELNEWLMSILYFRFAR